MSATNLPIETSTETRWTQVRAAGRGSDDAWRFLIQRHRPRIERCFRCLLGRRFEEDIVKDFFSYLYQHCIPERADPKKGGFRAFVLGIARLYVKTLAREERGLARGRGSAGDGVDQDREVEPVSAAGDDPAREVDRLWLRDVLQTAFARVRSQPKRRRGMDILAAYFGLDSEPMFSRDMIAARFESNANAVGVAVNRAAEWLRQEILAELRDTAASDEDLEAEVRQVLESLGP